MEYFFSHPKEKNLDIIRDFLLENSDTVELTEIEEKVVSWLFLTKKEGGKNDTRFLKTLDGLKEDFIKTIVNNTRFGGVEQFENDRFKHYYYKLSPRIKKIFKEEGFTLVYRWSKNLYGFEDPTFYKNGGMLGYFISHDQLFILHLTSNEKSALEKKGLEFEDFNGPCEDGVCSCKNYNKKGVDWGCIGILSTTAAILFFLCFGFIKYFETIMNIFRR